jgi:hypothetical protein
MKWKEDAKRFCFFFVAVHGVFYAMNIFLLFDIKMILEQDYDDYGDHHVQFWSRKKLNLYFLNDEEARISRNRMVKKNWYNMKEVERDPENGNYMNYDWNLCFYHSLIESEYSWTKIWNGIK